MSDHARPWTRPARNLTVRRRRPPPRPSPSEGEGRGGGSVVPSGPLQMVTTSASPPIARAATPTASTDSPSWRWVVPMVALLAGALGLRLMLWNRAVGFEQGDPLEYVNI